jgi:hypothetical protein
MRTFALDQLEDYAADGYRTLWLASGKTPADTDLGRRLRDECARRPLLRTVARI